MLVYIDNMTPPILSPDNFFDNNVKPKSNREDRQKDFRGYSLQIYPLICQNIKYPKTSHNEQTRFHSPKGVTKVLSTIFIVFIHLDLDDFRIPIMP